MDFPLNLNYEGELVIEMAPTAAYVFMEFTLI